MRLTTLCYINYGNEYLMLHRNKKQSDPNEGKWIGIGGGIKCGETPVEGMLREVYEETGIVLKKYEFSGIISFISDSYENEYMFLYTAEADNRYFKEDCDEGTLHWIHKDDMFSLNMWEGDKVFLEKILCGESVSELKLLYKGDKLVKYEFFDSKMV